MAYPPLPILGTAYIFSASFFCADLTTLVFSINWILSAFCLLESLQIFLFYWSHNFSFSWAHMNVSFLCVFLLFQWNLMKGSVRMCFKRHFEPHEKAKEFKVHSFSKKKRRGVGFLSLEVGTHTAGTWQRSGGWTRWQFCCLLFLKSCWRSSSSGIQADEFTLTISAQDPAESRMETFETGCLYDLVLTSHFAVSETRHRGGNKGYPANQQHYWGWTPCLLTPPPVIFPPHTPRHLAPICISEHPSLKPRVLPSAVGPGSTPTAGDQ